MIILEEDVIKIGEVVREHLQSPAVFSTLTVQMADAYRVKTEDAASMLFACYAYVSYPDDSFKQFLIDWMEDVVCEEKDYA